MGFINIEVGNDNNDTCGEEEFKINKKFKSYDEAEEFAKKLKTLIEKNLSYL